jgi:hypothetical protein
MRPRRIMLEGIFRELEGIIFPSVHTIGTQCAIWSPEACLLLYFWTNSISAT